jgi:hypothetical protein
MHQANPRVRRVQPVLWLEEADIQGYSCGEEEQREELNIVLSLTILWVSSNQLVSWNVFLPRIVPTCILWV